VTEQLKPDTHFVPVPRHFLREPHASQVGPALVLRLALENLVTAGDGTDGLVLGGKPVTDKFLGEQAGDVHPKTIASWRKNHLEKFGYIQTKRTRYGLIIRVKDSFKWALKSAKQRPPAPIEEQSPEKTPHPAWAAIGARGPFGVRPFQEVVEFYFTNRNGNSLADTLEQAIQRCQNQKIRIPPQLFTLKRAIEKNEGGAPAQSMESAKLVGAAAGRNMPSVRDIRPRER
jgi:hypothetical protein